MKYYRTTLPALSLTLGDAVTCDSATDDGIVLAARIPVLPRAVIGNLTDMTLDETAYIVLSQILGQGLQLDELNRLIKDTLTERYSLIDTENQYISTLNITSEGGTDIYSLSADFFMKLAEKVAPHRSTHFHPLFASLHRTPFQEAMCHSINLAGRRVLLLPRHDRADMAIDSIRGCDSKRIYVMALAGTPDNRAAMIEGLFSDRQFIRSKQIIVARETNIGAYLPVTVLLIHATALAERRYRGASQFDIMLDRYNPQILTGAAVAAAMHPQIRLYVADDLSKLTPAVAETLRRIGHEPSELFLSEARVKELKAEASKASPLIVINSSITRSNDKPAEHAGRHRFFHVVRNLDVLKKEIEIIK